MVKIPLLFMFITITVIMIFGDSVSKDIDGWQL